MTYATMARETLAARADELRARLRRLEAELDAPHSRDWEELAVEREGDEALEALGLSGQDELRRIDAALSRLENGAYGRCGSCGGAISEARLAVIPDAVLCRRCAGAARHR